MQTDSIIGFVGGGNMARSLIGGLVGRGHPAPSIRVYDIDRDKLQALVAEFSIGRVDQLADLRDCDVIVLAIKPQQMHAALTELGAAVGNARPLYLSIAAGIRSDTLARWLGDSPAIVRCMPNTPALIGAGASVLFGDSSISAGQRALAETVLSAVGITAWVDDEGQLDAVTALSGSGPAYYFLFQELMTAAGEKLGLSHDLSQRLATQTALGAARMVSESGTPAAELRRQVTSPGGTTEQALASFSAQGLDQLVDAALAAACERSRQLAELMDKEG